MGAVALRASRAEVESSSRHSVFVRLGCLLVLIAALSAGCGGAPDLTAADEANLSAHAVAELCATKCGGLTVYVVRGQILAAVGEEVGDEPAMSSELMSAIDDQLGEEVQFIDRLQAIGMVVDGNLVDRESIIVFVGPVIWLSDDVVGVQIGSHSVGDGAWGGTQQFRWTGQAWEPTDPEETGITTITMVS